MKLQGIKAICRYIHRSESTVLSKILNEGLPAILDPKTATWNADRSDIDKWKEGVRFEEAPKPERNNRPNKAKLRR